jgi:hypothetical protein
MPLFRRFTYIALCPLILAGLPACGDDDTGPAGDAGVDASLEPLTCPRDPSVCGNDVVEPGESCEPPGTATCDADCQRIPAEEPDPACDLTGHWAVEKVTVSAAVGINVQATTRNHMYYHIVQDGEDFEIVDSLDCNLAVDAPVLNVTIGSQTREALRCLVNSNGRTGTSSVNEEQCEIHFETHYTVRGLSPMEYWLDDDWATETMEAAAPTKDAPAMPNCSCDMQSCECDDTGRHDPGTDTPGWEDWERDGTPGITLRPGNSRWHVHMRDWDRFLGSTAQGSDEAPLDELELEVEWWNAQGLMAYTEGSIVVEEAPDLTADHHVTLKRLDTPDRNEVTDQQLCQTVGGAFQ